MSKVIFGRPNFCVVCKRNDIISLVWISRLREQYCWICLKEKHFFIFLFYIVSLIIIFYPIFSLFLILINKMICKISIFLKWIN